VTPGVSQQRATFERWAEFPGLERLDPPADRVALTFDDGPDPDATPAVLDALDASDVKATFFLVGEQVMAHRALAREVADRGHQIALHGFEHIRHTERSPREVRDDVARAVGAIEVATGRRPRYFRPPYGDCSEVTVEAVAELKLELVYWSGWGMDWELIPAERIAELVTRDLDPGAIVLLHDSPRYGDRPSAAPTAEALPLIAEAASERGLRLTPLNDG
jgi:peptidoglycan/xylan/chitin deacetylase (PgdA/CDA1 family)